MNERTNKQTNKQTNNRFSSMVSEYLKWEADSCGQHSHFLVSRVQS